MDNCRSRLYRLSAGRKFCQFGHVMEGNFEFDDDDGEQYVQTRRLNILLTDTGFGASASQATEKARSANTKRLYGRSGKIHLLRCLQYVLKTVTPKVVDLLYPDMEQRRKDIFKRDLTVVIKLMWVRCMEKVLAGAGVRLADLYPLIFLAIRLLNTYPVYVDDMLAILRENKVPYINALHMLPKDMQLLLSLATMALLTNSAIPLDDAFYKYVAKMATMVAPAKFWNISVEYFYPNVFSLFADLELDAPKLMVVFHRIMSRTSPTLLALKISGPSGLPDGKYLGMMYLIIKIYFVGSPTVVDFDLWLSWLQNQGARLPCFEDRNHCMDPKTLLDLSDEQTDEYCNWIYDNLLTGKHDEDLENVSPMESRLFKIFALKKEALINKPSEEIPMEIPKRSDAAKPPFKRVFNDLDLSHVSLMETHLSHYFCVRYGLKTRTFEEMVDMAESQLLQLIKTDELI